MSIFTLQTYASCCRDGCAERTSCLPPERHQKQYLMSSLSVSPGTERKQEANTCGKLFLISWANLAAAAAVVTYDTQWTVLWYNFNSSVNESWRRTCSVSCQNVLVSSAGVKSFDFCIIYLLGICCVKAFKCHEHQQFFWVLIVFFCFVLFRELSALSHCLL